ncbi:phage head spike fiber domain-containing protein [Tropicibacter sp. S64]|uniref:phage head spike fiber domain-containing protein n=1 Tax=Tropicibacter sp. S64 TaxID=3415122 RepID=UPI003C79E280
MAGNQTILKSTTALCDYVLVHRDRALMQQAISDLAQQLVNTGPVAQAIGRVEGLVTAGNLSAETWAQLQTFTPADDGAGGEVLDSDTGTHLAASATGYDGASVANAGRYRWNATWSRWVRIGGTGIAGRLSASANLSDVANPVTALANIGGVSQGDFNDGRYAATIIARGQLAAMTAGYEDPAQLASMAVEGGFIDPLNGDFLIGGETATALDRLPTASVSRASVAYALNAAGVYEAFAVDELRWTDRGYLIEGAATQLLAQPTNFTHAAWSKTGCTISAAAGEAPDGVGTAYDVVESATGSGISGIYLNIALPASVDACSSFVVERGANRYVMLRMHVASSTTAIVLDFDTGTVVTAGSAVPPKYLGVEALAGGRFRFYLTRQPTTSTTWEIGLYGCNNTTLASRTYTRTSGNVLARVSWAQVEAAAAPSSPILTGSATRPADAFSIDYPGTGADGDAVRVTYEGGSSSFTRADFNTADVADLAADGGTPWLGKYISQILLVPALGAAGAATATPYPGAIEPIRHALSRAMAASGLGPVRSAIPATVPAITDNGCAPYLYSDGSTFFFNGAHYAAEAAMLSAAGGSLVSGVRTFGRHVSDVDLLGGLTFNSDTGGFEPVGADPLLVATGGELRFTSTNTPDVFARLIQGFGARAFLYSGTARVGTAGNVQAATSRYDENMGTGTFSAAITSTSDVAFEIVTTTGLGNQFWIGGKQVGGTPGTSFFDDLKLFEVWPAPGFPNGNMTITLSGTLAGSLPGSTEVLWQGDTGDDRDLVRLELLSDGSIVLRRFFYKGTGAQNLVTLDSGVDLVGGATFRIAVSLSRSRLVLAVNGTVSEVDLGGIPGFAYFRVGSSFDGLDFGGTIDAYAVYAGAEEPTWCRRWSLPVASLPAPLIAATGNKLVLTGDSYAEAGDDGIGPMLEDLGYDVINIAVGGSSTAQQLATYLARTDLHHLPSMWWDGSPNGFVNQATAQSEIDDWVGAMATAGHGAFLYVRSGQIFTASGSDYSEMSTLYAYVWNTYGQDRVFDAQPTVAARAIIDPAATGYADDQTDLSAGRYPRSQMKVDNIHLEFAPRRDVVRAAASSIDRMLRLI